MIFLEQVRRNAKRHAVSVAFLYHANDYKTHAYDLLGFYHKEKRSTLVCDLI